MLSKDTEHGLALFRKDYDYAFTFSPDGTTVFNPLWRWCNPFWHACRLLGVFIACLAVVFTQCIISLLYGHTIATMILTMPVSNACRPRAESCSRHCVAPTDDRPRCVYRMCHIHTFSRLSKHPQTQARTHTSTQSPNEWCAQYAKVCESVDSLVGRCVVG